MSKVAATIIETKPFGPVPFKESAVQKVIDAAYAVAEVKADGCQLNLCVIPTKLHGTSVHWLSREGKAFNGLHNQLVNDPRWTKMQLMDELIFNGFMLQAEIITTDKKGNKQPCAKISGDLRREESIDPSRIKIVCFDIIPIDAVIAEGTYEVAYEIRREHLRQQLPALILRFPEYTWEISEQRECFSMEELNEFYQEVRDRKEEGLVVNDPFEYWKRGKKTGRWKMKPDDECDAKVIRPIWGTKGLANEGLVIGFTVITEHDVEVDATNITQDQMLELTAAVKEHGEDYHTGWACKITYMERLESGSYRHPSFAGFRGITQPLIKE